MDVSTRHSTAVFLEIASLSAQTECSLEVFGYMEETDRKAHVCLSGL